MDLDLSIRKLGESLNTASDFAAAALSTDDDKQSANLYELATGQLGLLLDHLKVVMERHRC